MYKHKIYINTYKHQMSLAIESKQKTKPKTKKLSKNQQDSKDHTLLTNLTDELRKSENNEKSKKQRKPKITKKIETKIPNDDNLLVIIEKSKGQMDKKRQKKLKDQTAPKPQIEVPVKIKRVRVRFSKKSYRHYNLKPNFTWEEVINYAENEKNAHTKNYLEKTAKKFEVVLETLKWKLKEYRKLKTTEQKINFFKEKRGLVNKKLTIEEEKKIYQEVVIRLEQHEAINNFSFLTYVYMYMVFILGKEITKVYVSLSWIAIFKKRFRLVSRFVKTKIKAPKDMPQQIEKYNQEITEMYNSKDFKPSMSWNFDEMRISLLQRFNQVFCPKGEESIKPNVNVNPKAAVTGILAVNEAGDHVMPTIIRKGETNQCCTKCVTPDLKNEINLTYSESGWVNTIRVLEFLEIIRDFNDKFQDRKGNRLYIQLDQHKSHFSAVHTIEIIKNKRYNVSLLAIKFKITEDEVTAQINKLTKIVDKLNMQFIFIPAGATSFLQVLDVGLNGPIKSSMSGLFMTAYMIDKNKKFSLNDCLEWLKEACKKVLIPANITSAWSKVHANLLQKLKK